MKSTSRHRVLGLSAALLFFLNEASFAKTQVVYVGSGGDNFSPKTITIEAGDKIEWSWDSSFHSTTSGTPGYPSGMWDSDVHQTGYKFTYEFNTPGSFPYYCSVHGGCCTMTGTVNVVAGSPSPTPSPSPSPSPHQVPHPHPHPHLHLHPAQVLRLHPAQVPRRLRSLRASLRALSGWTCKQSPAA